MNNELKAFGQRQQEAAQKNQIDPEMEAKIHADQVQAAQKMHQSELASQQKMQQRQAEFEQKMHLELEKHQLEMQKMIQTAHTELQYKAIRTAAETMPTKESVSINYKDAPQDIQRQMESAAGFQPSNDPVPQQAKVADVKLTEAQAKAAAQPKPKPESKPKA